MSAPKTPRRAVLGGSILALAGVDCFMAGGLGAAIAEHSHDIDHPDAALIAACEQHLLNTRAFNSHNEQGPEHERLWAAYEATRDLISDAVPLTMAGVLAKARAAAGEARGLEGQEQWGGSMGEGWAYDIVKDLLRLSGNPMSFEPDPEEDGEVEVLDQPHPDMDLIKAAQTFVAAEADYAANHWAEDDLDPRPDDRAAAKARLAAANAAQDETTTVLVERVATTLAGYQSKAKAAVAWYGAEPPNDGIGAEILWSLAQDLAEIA
jgi:hypothetical protein